jgi:hypothetical protein
MLILLPGLPTLVSPISAYDARIIPSYADSRPKEAQRNCRKMPKKIRMFPKNAKILRKCPKSWENAGISDLPIVPK